MAPGLLCDGALFAPLIKRLPRTCVPFIADFTSQNTIEAMAIDLLDSAPPRFALGGLSMGGIVAFEVYRQAPERIGALVLMNTTARPDTPEKQEIRRRQISLASRGKLEELVLHELKPNYLADQSKADQAIQTLIVEMANQMGEEVFIQQSRALITRPDSWSTLKEITCPVAFLTGDQDVLCPPELQREMASEVVHSTLHILPECGHLSTIESPDHVAKVISQTLQRITKEEIAA
jgi:pimeloyl-ACP methyl ester carboxylesterase